MQDYADVATFNIDAYQLLQPGETQEAQDDWTHWPNLGLNGCNAWTHGAGPAGDGSDDGTDYDPSTYYQVDPTTGRMRGTTDRSTMSVDRAKQYCESQGWCIGFEYGTADIYFKNRMCSFGRWDGAGNGLYLLGSASTEGFDHYEAVGQKEGESDSPTNESEPQNVGGIPLLCLCLGLCHLLPFSAFLLLSFRLFPLRFSFSFPFLFQPSIIQGGRVCDAAEH